MALPSYCLHASRALLLALLFGSASATGAAGATLDNAAQAWNEIARDLGSFEGSFTRTMTTVPVGGEVEEDGVVRKYDGKLKVSSAGGSLEKVFKDSSGEVIKSEYLAYNEDYAFKCEKRAEGEPYYLVEYASDEKVEYRMIQDEIQLPLNRMRAAITPTFFTLPILVQDGLVGQTEDKSMFESSDSAFEAFEYMREARTTPTSVHELPAETTSVLVDPNQQWRIVESFATLPQYTTRTKIEYDDAAGDSASFVVKRVEDVSEASSAVETDLWEVEQIKLSEPDTQSFSLAAVGLPEMSVEDGDDWATARLMIIIALAVLALAFGYAWYRHRQHAVVTTPRNVDAEPGT